jgi:hypothetical protein
MPDHLAIVTYRVTLRGRPAPGDLFGLLRIDHDALPPATVLHPKLTARAFQLLVRAGCAWF